MSEQKPEKQENKLDQLLRVLNIIGQVLTSIATSGTIIAGIFMILHKDAFWKDPNDLSSKELRRLYDGGLRLLSIVEQKISIENETMAVEGKSPVRDKVQRSTVSSSTDRDTMPEKPDMPIQLNQSPFEELPEAEPIDRSNQEFYPYVTKPSDMFGLHLLMEHNGVTWDDLKEQNPEITRPGQIIYGKTQIKLPVRTLHRVRAKQVLSVLAKIYGVTKIALMIANGKDRDYVERGEVVIIPYAGVVEHVAKLSGRKRKKVLTAKQLEIIPNRIRRVPDEIEKLENERAYALGAQ